jgi:phage pi2 protein 07
LEEYESTEDPDMDRTAMEDVREKKAARKNVLVTDALKSEIM